LGLKLSEKIKIKIIVWNKKILSLDREFNDESTCTKSATFHGRDERISFVGSLSPWRLVKMGKDFLLSSPWSKVLKYLN